MVMQLATNLFNFNNYIIILILLCVYKYGVLKRAFVQSEIY